MVNNASNWSLAGDVAVLNSLKKFSQVKIYILVKISKKGGKNVCCEVESVSFT